MKILIFTASSYLKMQLIVFITFFMIFASSSAVVSGKSANCGNGANGYFGYLNKAPAKNRYVHILETSYPDEQFTSEDIELPPQVINEMKQCQDEILLKLECCCHQVNDSALVELAFELVNCQTYVGANKDSYQCPARKDENFWNSYLLVKRLLKILCTTVVKLEGMQHLSKGVLKAKTAWKEKVQNQVDLQFEDIPDNYHEILRQFKAFQIGVQEYGIVLVMLKEFNKTLNTLSDSLKVNINRKLPYLLGNINIHEKLYVIVWHIISIPIFIYVVVNTQNVTRYFLICVILINLANSQLNLPYTTDTILLGTCILSLGMMQILYKQKMMAQIEENRQESDNESPTTTFNTAETNSLPPIIHSSDARINNLFAPDESPITTFNTTEINSLPPIIHSSDARINNLFAPGPSRSSRNLEPISFFSSDSESDTDVTRSYQPNFSLEDAENRRSVNFRRLASTKKKCSANTKFGTPCQNYPTTGTVFCIKHVRRAYY